MTRYRPSGHLGGTLGNRRHIGELAPAINASRARPARFARLTQRRQELTPQGATGQDIQPDIDGFR